MNKNKNKKRATKIGNYCVVYYFVYYIVYYQVRRLLLGLRRIGHIKKWIVRIPKASQFPITSQRQSTHRYMTTLQQVRCLNNQGVDLLISGQPSGASKAFQSALQLMASMATDDDDEGRVDVHIMGVLKLDDEVPDLVLGQSRSIVPDLQAEHFFVYNYAIAIMEPTVPKCNYETISQLSSAVMFNLALVFHRKGILDSGVSLKKASLLYTKCLEALSLSTAVQFKHTTTVLALLALNNQAQIQYELRDYAESSRCMTHVTSILETTSNLECSLLTTRNVVQEIYRNTMLWPTAAHAA